MKLQLFGWIVLLLILAKTLAQFWLERINSKNVRAHAGTIPEPFKNVVDPPTYKKSVDYTLAKSSFEIFELLYGTAISIAVLFSGVLPWFYQTFSARLGNSVWAGAAFLFSVGVLLSIPDLPLAWYAQFRLEEKFGFNTSTPRIFWMDRVKGLVLSLLFGVPLMALILWLVQKLGDWWWLWAFACVFLFQLIMLVLAPILILPLFNKFTPLPEGTLRDRLLALGDRTGFRAKDIQVMDGSKRSRHSNAFFTGFGNFRKIVLFDTLISQLAESELEAVLAHEIGHYKKRHIPKMLAWSAVTMLLGFFVISLLLKQDWFFAPFGFHAGNNVAGLLLFGFLSGTVTFWFSPIAHRWSRKHEYEADAFAAGVISEIQSLIGALRKLNEKNLSNLTPHPFYSGFYYSHPTLLEREQALQKIATNS